jgi:5-methylcytosine-specific restriction endonuclease McrA
MEEKLINSLYASKSKDSFKTKLNLYLFSKTLEKNKTELSLSEFKKFKIKEDLLVLYTTKYHQLLNEDLVNGKMVEDIYNGIKKLKKANKKQVEKFKEVYKEDFREIMTKEQFSSILNRGKCCYCGITEKRIDQLIRNQKIHKKANRGFKLEIERFDSNQEYFYKNVDLACYWCNNAKTDEFTKEEFSPIGEEISKIWEKRIK